MNKIQKHLPLILLILFTSGVYLFEVFTLKSIKLNTLAFGLILVLLGFTINYLNNSVKKSFSLFKINIDTIFLIEIVLSLGITFFLFFTRTHTFFDDSGFTLRYLDNFNKGYFYTYNPSDGPVFGISCFLNLIFCYGISSTQLFDPNKTLLLSNLIGLFFTSIFTLRILHKFLNQKSIVYLSWLVLILCSKHFLNVVFSGMESPFHLAIILASLYFNISNRPRLMWLFLSLSVISKLDAVPIALTIGIIYLINNYQRLLSFRIKNSIYSEIFIYCIIPLSIWLIFIYFLFGGIFPQSAYAKVFHYPHPDNSWFPFLDTYLNDRILKPTLILFVFLFFIQLIFWFWDKTKNHLYRLSPGFIAFASLLLYYFYNPSEKMLWYYVVPSYMILFQLIISIDWISEKLKTKFSKFFTPIILLAFILILHNDVKSSSAWMKKYLYTVENERIRIGEYLGKNSNHNQVLLARHGLISRPFKGYVIDNSGLNSRLATNYKMNTDSLIKDFHPNFAINHAWPEFLSVLNNNNYRLIKIFPDIALNDFPVWALFSPNTDTNKYIIKNLDNSAFSNARIGQTKMISKLKFENCIITPPVPQNEQINKLFLCVEKKVTSFNLKVEFLKNDSLISKQDIHVTETENINEISRFVQEVSIDIDNTAINKIRLISPDKSEVIIYSPFIEYRKK